MKDGDIFYLNQYPCRVRVSGNGICWFDFVKIGDLIISPILDGCELRSIIRDLFNVDSLGQYSKEVIRNLDRSIDFYDFNYDSCPSITDIESFNKYIKLLQSEIVACEIRKNTL